MNQLLETIYRTRRVQDEEGNPVDPFPAATPQETGEALYRLVLDLRCEQTLEIGMAYGLSTLFICQAHEDRGQGSHIAIDPVQSTRWKSIGLSNIQKAGLQHRLKFHEKPSHVALPMLLQEEIHLDFAFIDGAHLFDYALLDFFYVDKLLRVDGHIVIDDLWMPAVRKVLAFVASNRNYKIIPIHTDTRFLMHAGRVVRRVFQNPFERDPGHIRFFAGNICLLQKMKEDDRAWSFHRS
ncbi:MAG: O-methyltransferase, partial [Bryobacteraceae bacterium]